MIMVKGSINGKEFMEPFSKGVLARSLTVAEMGSKRAYNVASKIESDLIKKNITIISNDDLTKKIIDVLEREDPEVAKKYIDWRKIRQSNEPLILLLGGASGVGTSSIAFEIANRLGIQNLISTDMIREVMRKMISKELMPVIHESSFTAYEGLKVPPPLELDEVLAGFTNQVDAISVGVEAVIERALKEGISIIVEGVHVVPGFIKKSLIDKHNVIMFSLYVSDEEIHKGRFYSRSSQLWARRPLQLYLDNFDSIRKTQRYFISQSKRYDSKCIDNIDVSKTIDAMTEYIIKTYGGINIVK